MLEEIARGNGLGTARSIGASLGINQGTIYQILRTLQNSGYLHRLPGGLYHLGARTAYPIASSSRARCTAAAGSRRSSACSARSP